MYDITHDGKRGKIADACLDYGLDRIQFSAFYGDLRPNLIKELYNKTKEILGAEPGKILCIPISSDDWARRLEHIALPPAVIGPAGARLGRDAADTPDEPAKTLSPPIPWD